MIHSVIYGENGKGSLNESWGWQHLTNQVKIDRKVERGKSKLRVYVKARLAGLKGLFTDRKSGWSMWEWNQAMQKNNLLV